MDPNSNANFYENAAEYGESSSNWFARSSLLASIDRSELTSLKLTVTNDIEVPIPDLPLVTSVDDPVRISAHVHYKTGVPSKPLFGRDIKVNQDVSETVILYKYEDEKSPEKRRVTYEASGSRRDAARRSRENIYEERSRSRKRHYRRTPERRYSMEKSWHRKKSRERIRRSSSRSVSPLEHRCDCPAYGYRRYHKRRSRSWSPRYRSRSRSRKYSLDRRRSRRESCKVHRSTRSPSISPNRSQPSCSYHTSSQRRRSRSVSPRGKHKPDCPLYISSEYRRERSVTPSKHSCRCRLYSSTPR